jgi:DNA (cytosine-5)-methyltransferase 1
MSSNSPTFIDLFSGAGGLSIGLIDAGFKPLFANDFDSEISETYKLNHQNVQFYDGDISKLDYKKISKEIELKKGETDLIVGGPPCQGFSMANRKKIEADKRNLLFREFVRAVDFFQPKCFLIENVIGMNSETINESGKQQPIRQAMQDYFNDLGYSIAFHELNTEEHGVPQYRRRSIVIGTNLSKKRKKLISREIGNLEKKYLNIKDLKKINKSKSNSQIDAFTETSVSSSNLPKPTTVWESISDLPQIKAGGGKDTMAYKMEPANDFQKLMRRKSKEVCNHISTPHAKNVIERLKLIAPGQNYKDLPKKLQTKSCHSGAYGRLEPNGLSPTITTRFDTPSTGRVIHPKLHRTLTVREAARIQSFPDHFIFYGSRTSQGKQIGNAVPPLAAKSIGEMFIKDFLS